MKLFAAIDLLEGQAVRLLKGDFSRSVIFGEALSAARSLVDQGFRHFHVVDLEAARTGAAPDYQTLSGLRQVLDGRELQVGGGVRSIDVAKRLFEIGVDRVVVSTAALEDEAFLPSLTALAPRRVSLAVDLAGDQVVVRGWTQATGTSLKEVMELAEDLEIHSFIVTSVVRDGTLKGPDLALYRRLLELTSIPVTASGGVSSLEDLKALSDLEVKGRRLYGVVVGMAIYTGALPVTEALALCET